MKIQLHCGKTVSVKHFEFYHTYSNLSEGGYNLKTNTLVFNHTSYPENWGNRKLLKIKPCNNEFNTKLKPITYTVWLDATEAINKNYDGSELIVIWFGNKAENKTLKELITEGVQHINWNANAQDYEYDF